LQADDYIQLVADFQAIYTSEYQLVELTPTVVDKAQSLLERYPLRTYDAVQLASALCSNEALQTAKLPPLVFLAADNRLLKAAIAEGLSVDNPNDHS
jgi:predicted nucleic acid-binding protein